jgi:hypothetical protein
VNSTLALDAKRGILTLSVAHGACNLTLGDQDMTSQTLRITLIVAAALAAVSVGACKKTDAGADANNTAAASDANAAANTAMAASNTATAAANSAANDASATAPASTNSMSK